MGVICLGKICNITYIRRSGEIGIGKISGEFCSKREEIVGYRLYEREAGSIRDIKVNELTKSLKDGARIENLALDNNGYIRFTAEDESRYSLIYGNETMGCGNIIVLAKIIGTDKYKVTDSSGVTYYMSTEEIISKHSGLANVKIVYKNNKCFISAINGTIPEENIKINNRKRFVMLYYKGTKNNLSKAYGYYCYNLETNKIYNKSKMKGFREQEMSMTTVESLCRKGNNILSLNQDIYENLLEEVITNKTVKEYDSTVIVKHYTNKRGEIKFVGVRIQATDKYPTRRISEFSLKEILESIRDKNKDIIVKFLNNKIVTGSTIYECTKKDLEIINSERQVKIPNKDIEKLKTKISIVGLENVMRIDKNGTLTNIDYNKFNKGEVVSIPKEIKSIHIDVLCDNFSLIANEITLVIPETVETLVRGRLKHGTVIACHKIICKSEGLLKEIIKLCGRNDLKQLSSIQVAGVLETPLNINEKDWVKLTKVFKNINANNSNSLDGAKIEQIIENECTRLLKFVSDEKIDKRIGSYMKSRHMYINYEEIVNKQIKRDIQFELESAYNGLNILENKIKNNNIQNCTYKNIANTKIKIKERVKELG